MALVSLPSFIRNQTSIKVLILRVAVHIILCTYQRIMRNRRQSRRNKSYLATMTVLGFISSSTSIRRDLSRTFVRAAFTSGGVGSRAAFGGGVGSHHHAYTNSRQFNNHVISTKFALHAREPRMERSMSTAAASDQELDSALDELLGEALKEAENPAADAEVGGRGHIEGSHPFPKELVETVCRIIASLVAFLLVFILVITHSYENGPF